jgi:hypothetical protein
MSKPVAWLAVAADGSESSAVYMLREQADAAARAWGWTVVPLYRTHESYRQINEKRINTAMDRDTTPGDGSVQGEGAITDEEREAIAWYACYGAGNHSATLRALLDRLT